MPFFINYIRLVQPFRSQCGDCGDDTEQATNHHHLKERSHHCPQYFTVEKYESFSSKLCSNCSKPASEVSRMVDKIVSTRDEIEQQPQSDIKSRTYLQLVRDKKKGKKKKKRTKDKCSQKKERKATQTLAIVLGENTEITPTQQTLS